MEAAPAAYARQAIAFHTPLPRYIDLCAAEGTANIDGTRLLGRLIARQMQLTRAEQDGNISAAEERSAEMAFIAAENHGTADKAIGSGFRRPLCGGCVCALFCRL